MMYSRSRSRASSIRGLLLRTLVTSTLTLSATASLAGAQSGSRQVVDTGTRNVRPGRPMSAPRSAGGMSGMKETSGMKDTAGMSGMAGMKDTSGMAGMNDTSGMSAGAASPMASMMAMHMSMMAMMELHMRMMADPSIQQRVMNDPVLRPLADQANGPVADDHARDGMMMSDSAHAGMSGAKAPTTRPRAPRGSLAPGRAKSNAVRKPDGMSDMPGMSRSPAPSKPRTAKRPPARAATTPSKQPAVKKAPPMPPMPGMDHSKMPGMGKP